MLIRNVLTFILFCCFTVSLPAAPQLAVHLDRSSIYEGESFIYQLVLTDSNPLRDSVTPDMSGLTNFDVQFLGMQDMQQGGTSFTVIIQGKTIRDDRSAVAYSKQFSYQLTPKRTGSQVIPLPKVVVNGTTLLPQTLTIGEEEQNFLQDYSIAVQVITPENQDLVFMSIETNRDRLYPLQPLDVTLVIQIKALPERLTETNPIVLLRQPPQLQIPWATEEPNGFQAAQQFERWLIGLLVRSPQRGFSINGLASNRLGLNDDVFNIFSGRDPFQKVLLQFASSPRQVSRLDAQGNEAMYWEYRFTRTFVPKEFGNYSFGPATLKGTFPAVADANVPEGLVPQQVYVIAQPATVAVADVPQDNRPADYIGAFGTFRWEVNLTPQKVRVGDPMTLTLSLVGQGSTANVRPPDLSANPEVVSQFRVHMPPTEEFNEQSCTFTYTIRPLHAGQISFPAITASVFDVNKEQFVSLQSSAIPLEIDEAETVQSATVFGNVSEGDIQLAEGGLFANKTTLTETLPAITFTQGIAVIALLTGSYSVFAFGLFLRRIQWMNPKLQRQRGAWYRAKTRLAEISSTLRGKHSVNLVEVSSELQGVFFGYIADRFDCTEQGMTTKDACQQLLKDNAPEPLVETVRSALEALDGVKYGGMDVRSLDEWTTTAHTLLRQLERSR